MSRLLAYVVPDDGALFKCYVCNKSGSARTESFVKLEGTFGVRHSNCVSNLNRYKFVTVDEYNQQANQIKI